MKIYIRLSLLVLTLSVVSVGCVNNNTNSVTTVQPTPQATNANQSQSKKVDEPRSQLTLPVLDALLANDSFVSEIKSKLQISDEQINSLKSTASSEVERLRTANAEEQVTNTTGGRTRASEEISRVLGDDKGRQLILLADEFWARGGDSTDTAKQEATTVPAKPNAVPADTRIVVNIPAYRMDLFKDGSLIKSYKIGIGYPEFPLPQGLRKAQTIIFNPTWTPPDSPWVAKMKVTPGEKIEAGSKLNPLGPIKIPIGMPSLIHGGKSPAKLGAFASHGCVGLTNAQVKDFAQFLGQISNTEVSVNSINTYLKDPTHTQVLKLKQTIPVELRYETIVIQDGQLHIYKDVYDEDANTEARLQEVLEAHGIKLEDLSAEERSQTMTALNLMSAHPQPTASPSTTPGNTNERKGKRAEKKPAKNQKEMVVQLTAGGQKGYPSPVNFDDGTGKPKVTASNIRN